MRRLIGAGAIVLWLREASCPRRPYLRYSAPHLGGNIGNDDPAFGLHATDVAHSGVRPPCHRGGGHRELLHSIRGGGACRALAVPGKEVVRQNEPHPWRGRSEEHTSELQS